VAELLLPPLLENLISCCCQRLEYNCTLWPPLRPAFALAVTVFSDEAASAGRPTDDDVASFGGVATRVGTIVFFYCCWCLVPVGLFLLLLELQLLLA
jgi:hypothetical protein